LFHELGHILLHDKRTAFLENGAADPALQKHEEDADKFAQKTLILEKEFQIFKQGSVFSISSIKFFANSIGIVPGIVTGRLHHDKCLPYTFYGGRIRYKWK